LEKVERFGFQTFKAFYREMMECLENFRQLSVQRGEMYRLTHVNALVDLLEEWHRVIEPRFIQEVNESAQREKRLRKEYEDLRRQKAHEFHLQYQASMLQHERERTDNDGWESGDALSRANGIRASRRLRGENPDIALNQDISILRRRSRRLTDDEMSVDETSKLQTNGLDKLAQGTERETLEVIVECDNEKMAEDENVDAADMQEMSVVITVEDKEASDVPDSEDQMAVDVPVGDADTAVEEEKSPVDEVITVQPSSEPIDNEDDSALATAETEVEVAEAAEEMQTPEYENQMELEPTPAESIQESTEDVPQGGADMEIEPEAPEEPAPVEEPEEPEPQISAEPIGLPGVRGVGRSQLQDLIAQFSRGLQISSIEKKIQFRTKLLHAISTWRRSVMKLALEQVAEYIPDPMLQDVDLANAQLDLGKIIFECTNELE
jgi:hypothetical protein